MSSTFYVFYITYKFTIIVPNCCCPVGWGGGAVGYMTASLQRDTSHNECPGYDTKKSGDGIPVILEFGGMWSAPIVLRSTLLCSGSI